MLAGWGIRWWCAQLLGFTSRETWWSFLSNLKLLFSEINHFIHPKSFVFVAVFRVKVIDPTVVKLFSWKSFIDKTSSLLSLLKSFDLMNWNFRLHWLDFFHSRFGFVAAFFVFFFWFTCFSFLAMAKCESNHKSIVYIETYDWVGWQFNRMTFLPYFCFSFVWSQWVQGQWRLTYVFQTLWRAFFTQRFFIQHRWKCAKWLRLYSA